MDVGQVSFHDDKKVLRVYSGTSLIRTPMGQKKASLLVRCPNFRGCKSGTWGAKRCPV